MQLQKEVNQLFSSQQEEWDQLARGIRQLDDTKVKTISWDNQFHVNVQYNPRERYPPQLRWIVQVLKPHPVSFVKPIGRHSKKESHS